MTRKRLSSSDRGRLFALILGLVIGIMLRGRAEFFYAFVAAMVLAGVAYFGLKLSAEARRAGPHPSEHEPAA